MTYEITNDCFYFVYNVLLLEMSRVQYPGRFSRDSRIGGLKDSRI